MVLSRFPNAEKWITDYTYRVKCHILRDEHGYLVVRDAPELHSDHKEANTRILLDAENASICFKHVIIKSPNSKVSILSLSISRFLAK